MQLYMSWYIRLFFGFTFLNILYFFKYSCTNIFHRRSLYTFYVYSCHPFVLTDCSPDCLGRLHLQIGNHQMSVQRGQVYYRTKISGLLWNKKQPAEEAQEVAPVNWLYGPLLQQAVHGLLKILFLVPGWKMNGCPCQRRLVAFPLQQDTRPQDSWRSALA